MSREIKFRGISQYTGKMVYGQLLRGENNFNIVTNFTRVLDIELVPIKKGTQGQFTGLHDKNGKEIYEGDIVKWKEIIHYYETHYSPNIPTPTNEFTERYDTIIKTNIDYMIFQNGSFILSRDLPLEYCASEITDDDIEYFLEDEYFRRFGYETIDELIKDLTSEVEVIGNIYENSDLLGGE